MLYTKYCRTVDPTVSVTFTIYTWKIELKTVLFKLWFETIRDKTAESTNNVCIVNGFSFVRITTHSNIF